MLNQKLPKIWHGGDYNPDQWPRSVWDEDMRLFRLARIDIATLPVFSWALLQPEEERYEFGWLDEALGLLAANGVYACLATSTGAHPAWMARRYPDVCRIDFHGRKRRFGFRHNSCPNSPTYRHYAERLAGKLAERYAQHPSLVIWHISNEYGGYCYCDNCASAFRAWLRRRYGTLDELNERWSTRFWGHTFYDWDEIVPPNLLTEHFGPNETAFQSISLDYNRFQSDSLLECYRLEYDVIKRYTPDVPVTTNLMGTYKPLDYFAWARHMDVVSWDNYPTMKADPAGIALRHDLMRSLKGGAPFMLMEQTPNQQNWQAYNAVKRPGVMRLWSYQAVARGADTVMYFQLRQSRGACEKWHGAVIPHAGHAENRIFREVADLGRELEQLADALLDSRAEAQVAILFDWENWWALEFSSGPSVDLKYIPQVEKYYRACWQQQIAVDFVHPSMPLDRYKVLIAPVAYLLQPGFAQQVEEFVARGGTFVTSFLSGMVDGNDRVVLGGYPGELRRVTGVWAEEFDALFPDQKNAVVIDGAHPELHGRYECGLICGILHAETAEPVGLYADDFYAGTPALTRNRFGRGTAWYVGTDPDQSLVDRLVGLICREAGVAPLLAVPSGVEVAERVKEGRRFLFVLNHNAAAVRIDLEGRRGRDLLTGQPVEGSVALAPRGVLIAEFPGPG
jgi:beta-galactosidase